MDVTTTEKAAEILSLQARIEQCEAAIDMGHSIISKVQPVDDSSEKTPEVGGAIAAIDRCIRRMSDLNDRLSAVAEKVGAL